jgi:double-stranded uracil-DNA glycosylase
VKAHGFEGGNVPWRPTVRQLEEARGRSLRDVIAPGLLVLFSGINPSLYSAAVGHHFARPGNRFWRALFQAELTERLLSPFEDSLLLERRLGCTNLVPRATARADELSEPELRAGACRLRELVGQHRPAWLAVLGVSAYRAGFGVPRARVGAQQEQIGETRIWVLPNPSGLNAHYQLPALVEAYRELRQASARSRGHPADA